MRGDEVVSVRGDADDVFSRGFLCPKSQGLKQLHDDPDRLTKPLVRRDGELVEASWEEAFEAVAEGLGRVLGEGGRDAVAVYIGNPAAHSLGPVLYGTPLLKALGTKNIYSASTVDQMPKQVSAGLMFGAGLSVPVPDVDRTDHLLILGANPLVSNGSLLTAPDMRGRLRAIRERGGKVVVVDPRRSRTAKEASEHHFIRPGTDAHLLFAIANVLLAEQLADPGRLAEHANDAELVAELAEPFTPEAVEAVCGIAADEIRRLARELAGAEHAAVYARIGTTTQRFGTLASWLVDVLNYLTGNLDREGGAMFPLAAAAQRNSSGRGPTGKGVRVGRWQSRVSGRGEVFGELPVAGLAEEIATPGDGQVRGADHDRRQPAGLDPRLGSAGGGGRDARVHGLGRHLRQRDHPPRRRRPPGARAARQGPLRRGALPARRTQRGQLVGARARASRGSAARVGGDPEARRDRRRTGARRRHRGLGRARDPDPDRARGGAARLPDRGPRPGRDRGGARRAPRARADHRLHGPRRPVRRGLRRRPRGPDPGAAGGEPARDRPRPDAPPDPGRAANALGTDRAGAARDRRRRPEAARRAGGGGDRPQRRDGADRPPPAALQQLLDAQPAGVGQGQGPVHGPGPPRRRRAARARRGRPRARLLGQRRAGRAGRDHRRDHARRGLDPARLGTRRSRQPDGGGRRPRRGQLEPAGAGRRRRALRQRGPQRDPGRGRRGRPRAGGRSPRPLRRR